jgi:hypothetical protein
VDLHGLDDLDAIGSDLASNFFHTLRTKYCLQTFAKQRDDFLSGERYTESSRLFEAGFNAKSTFRDALQRQNLLLLLKIDSQPPQIQKYVIKSSNSYYYNYSTLSPVGNMHR